MKFLVSFVLIFLIFELQSDFCAARNNTILIGKRVKGDELLKTLEVKRKPGRTFYPGHIPKLAVATVKVEKKTLKNKKITAIRLDELEYPKIKTGPATVKVLNGGIKKKDVKLRLTGAQKLGFRYKVSIYGK